MQEYNLAFPIEVVGGGLQRAFPSTTGISNTTIAPHISAAEERFLIPFFGQQFFENAVSKRNSQPSDYTAVPQVEKFPNDPALEALWKKYLWRYCAEVTFLEALPYMQFEIAENGIFTNDTEFSKNAGRQGLNLLTDQGQRRIANLERQIKIFVCQNKSDYPLISDLFCSDLEGCQACNYTGYITKLNKIAPCQCTQKGPRSNIIFY